MHTIPWGPDHFPIPAYKPKAILHDLIFWDNSYLIQITYFHFVWFRIAFIHKLFKVGFCYLLLVNRVLLTIYVSLVVVEGSDICVYVCK